MVRREPLVACAVAAAIAVAAGCGGGGTRVRRHNQRRRLEHRRAVRHLGGRGIRDETGRTSPSGSRVRVAASSASVAARPTSRTPRGRSRTRKSAICEENGVEYVELQVANDALTVVVNPENDWATCLTVEELKRNVEAGLDGRQLEARSATASRTSHSSSSVAGTDSGTFDYFTDVINGEEGASRTDYSASEDDNVHRAGRLRHEGRPRLLRFLVLRGEPGDAEGGRDRRWLRAASRQASRRRRAGTTPRSRDRSSSTRSRRRSSEPEVEDFLRYMLENETAIAEAAQFVPLNETQVDDEPREARRGDRRMS